MKKKFRHIVERGICWILLVQLVNISINAPDFMHTRSGSVVSGKGFEVNEIESIYELISEVICDTDVPESDEDEIDTSSQSIELFCAGMHSKLLLFVIYIEHYSNYQNNSPPVYQAPHFPPPKVA